MARTAHFVLHRLMLDSAAGGEAPAVGAAHALMAPGQVWLGALVPKRWARRAVTRNAIRRQIYRIASDFEPQLAPAAHVVRLRAAFDRKVYVSASSDALKGAVRDELRALFERANRGRP